MPTQAVYDALPEGHRQVMQQTQIHPVVNRSQKFWYHCDACGVEWAEESTRGYLFWWACPQGCNWESIPGFADIMRQRLNVFVDRYTSQWRSNLERRRRPPISSDHVSLKAWSEAVDQLVAEVRAHHQDEPREER
jgi:hypothetical protein